jgi:hypothetical protein
MIEYKVNLSKVNCSSFSLANNKSLISVDTPLLYINSTNLTKLFYNCRNLVGVVDDVF